MRNLFEREFLRHKSIQHKLFESLARARAGEPSAFCNPARSVSVLFGVPRCLPPRLSPGFEPPPGMVSGYFCCQWLLAGT